MTHLLVLMGSGETTPTMVATHQRVLAALGPDASALVLDTPYGFQENADELSARTLGYFARNVGHPVELCSLRSTSELDAVAEEALLADVAEADWLFAGPGSPTYLARQWTATRLPEVLRARLQRPGATVVASAAACTLGVATLPVYEIYKAGEPPHWHAGLDLLASVGLDAVVIPHFDNAEGGTHDTRYCYLGRSRLEAMESLLPDGTWVLGVDEHTALVLELGPGRAQVEGRGGVTVRAHGREHRVEAGTSVTISELIAATRTDGGPGPRASSAAPAGPQDGDEPGPAPAASPLLEQVAEHAGRFDAALQAGDPLAAARETVALTEAIRSWASDPLRSDEPDRAHAELQRQIVAIARVAAAGLHEHRALIAPLAERLLALRAQARAAGRYEEADAIRAALADGGVEVRDLPDGPSWYYEDPVTSAAGPPPPRAGRADR